MRPLRQNGVTRDQVRELIPTGMTDKEIGRKLGLHFGTIKYHVGVIMREVGARNRTQAAVAISQGDKGG